MAQLLESGEKTECEQNQTTYLRTFAIVFILEMNTFWVFWKS